MKDMAAEDRPRERLCRLGAAALSNAELLAVLVGQRHKIPFGAADRGRDDAE